MTVSEALAALRALDALPTGRRQTLARFIVEAPTDAERAQVVRRATQEALRSQEAVRRDFANEYVVRQDWASRNPQRRAMGWEEGRVGGGNYRSERITAPEARPVRISWSTPRRPDIVRADTRPEQSEGFETTRADRARAQKKRSANGTVEHGTPSRYVRGCRCQPCTDANTAYARERRARRKAEKGV